MNKTPVSICLSLRLILNLSNGPRKTNLTDNLLGVQMFVQFGVGVAANAETSTSCSVATPRTVGQRVSINRNTSSKRFFRIEFISVRGYLRQI
jgi:hypothetical protein